MEVLEFAVALPPAIYDSWDNVNDFDEEQMNRRRRQEQEQPSGIGGGIRLEDQQQQSRSQGPEIGIVGTIMLLKNAAMIWFKWGHVMQVIEEDLAKDQESCKDETQNPTAKTCSIGNSYNMPMGPLFVAMPRTDYRGAFSDSNTEGAVSKLIGGGGAAADGGDNTANNFEDTEMIARQMASRLSKRLGMPIFISCSFEGAPQMARDGIDQTMPVEQRAAAVTEKEIARILLEKFPPPAASLHSAKTKMTGSNNNNEIDRE